MTSLGPCFEEGFECPTSHLNCYKDCCQRGIYFCNHREKRCQKCEARVGLCGSFKVPWECDVYCLRQEMQHNSTMNNSSLVSQGYRNATIGLSVVVAVLIAVHITSYCRSQLRTRKTESVTDDKDEISTNQSTDETAASCEDSRKAGLGDFAKDSVKLAATAEPLNGCIAMPPESTNCQRIGNTPVLPTRETTQLLGQDPFCRQDDRLCNCSNGQQTVTEEQRPLMESTEHVPTSSTPPAEHHHPRTCRDPRLDNISPTNDSDRDVFPIHTESADYYSRINSVHY